MIRAVGSEKCCLYKRAGFDPAFLIPTPVWRFFAASINPGRQPSSETLHEYRVTSRFDYPLLAAPRFADRLDACIVSLVALYSPNGSGAMPRRPDHD